MGMGTDFIELKGRKFSFLKLSASMQFHVVRRIAPILAELLPQLSKSSISDISKLSESEKLQNIATFVTPIMMGLNKLTDIEADYVLYTLLHAVEMQQATGNWIRIAQPPTPLSPPLLTVQDMELPDMLMLAGKAFLHNLSGFSSVLQQKA